jgi:excisionase family DNA binding protein
MELARVGKRGPSWLTVDEAAQRLRISPAAVRMRASRGRLAIRRRGRRLYISAASVDDLEPPAR